MSNVEDLFITRCQDKQGNEVTFAMIEDEGGEMWWGFGHIYPPEFIDEVNRWFVHQGMDPFEDDCSVEVAHLWARQIDDERFDIVEPTGTESDSGIFPITRIFV